MNTKVLIGVIAVIVILAGLYVLFSNALYVPPASYTTNYTTNTSYTSGSSNLFVALTDPPSVPANTTALTMEYSDVQVHEIGSGNSGFVNTGASGSINLLSVVNLTKTIAAANVSANSSINLVRFTIASVMITVDGKQYNVTVPNNVLTVNVRNNATISANSTRAVLVDMNPSVLEIYSGNQTIFLMVPSAKAVLISNASGNGIALRVGGNESLKRNVRNELNLERGNISISSASLSNGNNETSFSVTVKDNGNSSVVIKNILLYGYMKADFNATIVNRIIKVENESERVNISSEIGAGRGEPTGSGQIGINGSSSEGSNAGSSARENETHKNNSSSVSITANATINSSIIKQIRPVGFQGYGGYGYGSSTASTTVEANSNEHVNASEPNSHANAYVGGDIEVEVGNVLRSNATYGDKLSKLDGLLGNRINASLAIASHLNVSGMEFKDNIRKALNFEDHFHNTLNFLVSTNGTLILPFTESEAEGPNGYTINAGQSVTFAFNGIIARGESPMAIMPIDNETYGIRVTGKEGVSAQANVTAS